MKILIFSVKDIVSQRFGPLFEQPNVAAAKRAVKAMIKADANAKLADFELRLYGSRDMITGEITLEQGDHSYFFDEEELDAVLGDA